MPGPRLLQVRLGHLNRRRPLLLGPGVFSASALGSLEYSAREALAPVG